MLHLLISLLFVSSSAFASDEGLEQLRKSFSEQLQSSKKIFDRAAQMKPIPLPVGAPLSKDECEAIKAKIIPNYKINPFQFSYEHGGTSNAMCGGQVGWEKNYVLNKSGVNQFGLPYAMVVQLFYTDTRPSVYVISNFYLDSAYKLIEIQGLSVNTKTGETFSYAIRAVDQAGNVYFSGYDKNYSISGGLAKDVKGEHRLEMFVAVDGTITYPIVRNTIKNLADPSKDYQIVSMSRTDKKDWDEFELPITYSSSGGFYQYGGKWYSVFNKPNFQSGFYIKYRGGVEHCANGFIRSEEVWQSFPVDQKKRQDCANY